jgi:hypothetical protein
MLLIEPKEEIMKATRLLNTAALTIGLILGQYAFAIDQSSAQIESEYESDGAASLETLENQGLPIDEDKNYTILGIGGPSPEFQPTLILPEVPGNWTYDMTRTQRGRITIGACETQTIGIRTQMIGICFQF